MDDFERRWYKAWEHAQYMDYLKYWHFIGEIRPCDCSDHQAVRAHIIAHGFGAHDVKKTHACLLCNPELSEYLYLALDKVNPMLTMDV